MSEDRPVRRGKITIRDVAEDAGVSVAAVSKVMRKAYGVSDVMRSNVLESIEKLGYRPSTAARGMRGRTYTIGILLVEIGNPFLPKVIAGIKSVLAPAGYQSLIGVGEAERRIESSLIEAMIDTSMDGLILVAPRLAGNMLARFAKQTPVVAVGHHEPEAGEFDTVNSDDRKGAFMATRALLEAGHTRPVMLSLHASKSDWTNVYVAREKGYEDALREAGRQDAVRILRNPEHLEFTDSDFPFPPDEDTPRSAVFCWSDLHGVELINQAKVRGYRVPQDLAIVGYDNSPIAAMPLIDLSSVDQNPWELGRRAGAALLTRIGGRTTAEHIVLEPRLIRRSSF